jgi:hypothetical protein
MAQKRLDILDLEAINEGDALKLSFKPVRPLGRRIIKARTAIQAADIKITNRIVSKYVRKDK